MDKTLNKLFVAILAIVMGVLAYMMLSPMAVYATDNQKKYEYVVHTENNLFVISGVYENGGNYGLGASQTLEGVMQVIDYDREINSAYQDAKINFQNLDVGNDCLMLTKGNITLTGSLVGANFSSLGLVYIKGASVTLEDFVLKNYGPSYLVRNDGSGNLNFVSGTYSSCSTGIISKGPADINILGGNFSSTNSSAIEFIPSSPVAKLAISAESQTIITSQNQNLPTIKAKNAVLDIVGGTIKHLANGKAISLENVLFSISNNPKVSGGTIAIETNQVVLAEGYIGDVISLYFNQEIVAGQTIVVEGVTSALFLLRNEGFTLTESAGNLVASKTYSLIYVDQNEYLRFVPTESRMFLPGAVVEAKMPSSASFKTNILNLVNFLGWSEDPLATAPTYTEDNLNITFESKDKTLYAVWENREYHINYVGIEDSVNNNPLDYTANTETTIENPEKKYYKFLGWVVNGAGQPQTNLVLPATTYGDLTLTAVWALQTYNIIYNGLPDNVVASLNLPVSYTIESQPFAINLHKVLAKGYTYFGVYLDPLNTIVCDEIIYFEPSKHKDNSANFNATNKIGEDINIYVDAKAYFNGLGDGSAENPFMLSSFEQFQALMVGKKVQSSSLIYVTLANDLTFSQKFMDNSKLSGVVVDGAQKNIYVERFSKINGVVCVFPNIENAEIKNLVVSAPSQTIFASSKTNFAGLAGKIVDSKLQNIKIDMPINVVCDGISTLAIIKFGALTLLAENSVFDGVSNLNDFEVQVLSAGGDVNIYGAGLVGFDANNCLFINCKQMGNILVEISALPYETNTYIAGLVCVGNNNKIVNSLNAGTINLVQETANSAVLCGLVMPFGTGNLAENVAVTEAILAQDDAENVKVEEISPAFCSQNNVFLPTDFETDANQAINKLVKNMDSLQTKYGVELCTWFNGANGIDFTKGIYVKFVGGEMMPTQTLYFATPEEAKNAYLWFDTNKFMFYGWKMDNGEYVDWNNVLEPSITLTADYALFEDLLLYEFIKLVAFACLVLIFVLFIMWLFDRKKMVYFVKCGRPVGTAKVARTKKIPMPKEFEDKICFLDKKGCKPFLVNKMPYHSITLYVFDEFKQTRLENRIKFNEENQKQLALNKILLKGIMRARRKEMKKVSKQKNLPAPHKEKANAVVIGDNDNKITIIKKEIKVIKNEENKTGKNKNASKKIKKSKK